MGEVQRKTLQMRREEYQEYHAPPDRLIPYDPRNDPHLGPPKSVEDRNADMVLSWQEVFTAHNTNLDDLVPQRMRLCWRVVRQIAIHNGVISNDQPLSSINSVSDPWNHVPEIDHQGHSTVRKFTEQHGPIPALPPKKPVDEFDPFNPDEDPLFHRYLAGFAYVASELGAANPIKGDSARMRVAVKTLLDPSLMRDLFPEAEELQIFEAFVVSELVSKITERGVGEGMEWAREEFHLTAFELNNMKKMAISHFRNGHLDTSDARAIMVARLEDYIRRAKKALDLRAEMYGMKQLSIVQGLTSVEDRNPMADLVKMAQKVAREREAIKDVEFKVLDHPGD